MELRVLSERKKDEEEAAFPASLLPPPFDGFYRLFSSELCLFSFLLGVGRLIGRSMRRLMRWPGS